MVACQALHSAIGATTVKGVVVNISRDATHRGSYFPPLACETPAARLPSSLWSRPCQHYALQ